MSPNPPRTTVTLAQLAPGTPFRLFSKYRDKSPRPRFKFGQFFLAQHELVVEEHVGCAVVVGFKGRRATLWNGLKVVL